MINFLNVYNFKDLEIKFFNILYVFYFMSGINEID